jgi:hypothetical protein
MQVGFGFRWPTIEMSLCAFRNHEETAQLHIGSACERGRFRFALSVIYLILILITSPADVKFESYEDSIL